MGRICAHTAHLPGKKGESSMKPHLAGYRKKRSRFGSGIVTLVMLVSLLWGGMAWNVQEASAASKFDN